MASGKHRKPKDSLSTRHAIAVCLGASVASPLVLASESSAAPVSAWDRVAECESNGRWNLPSGHATSTGGLQIQTPTWLDYGGAKYGAHAYLATKQQQIEIAEKILAGQGPRAWSVTWNGGAHCNNIAAGALTSSGPNASVHKGGIDPYPSGAPAAAPKPVTPKPAAPSEPVDAEDGVYVVKGAGPVTVMGGDTLYGIAAKLGAGDGKDNWKPLYAANVKVIGKNPNLILPGQKLNVPESWSGKSYKGAPDAHSHRPNDGSEGTPAAPADPPKVSAPTGAYVMPVQGRVGDSLIITGNCISRSCGGHSGLDITAPQGTPVRAAAAGTVASVNASGASYGLHVVVKHADGRYTLYAHLSAISVSNGQTVGAGQQVGNVGSTGNSSGPHLHFEVRTHPTDFSVGTFLNPVTWLRSHGATV